MDMQVINGINMINVESFPWKTGMDHPYALSCHDMETWLCTLKSVWKLEQGKDDNYYDEKQKHAKKTVRRYFISIDVACMIACLYRDHDLYRELIGEEIEKNSQA